MHQEYHSAAFSEKGGMFEMLQLWVNLPAKDKMTKPKYQAITAADIPVVTLTNDAGSARIIAGNFENTQGKASTFTPVNMWDVVMNAGKSYVFSVPESHNLLILVREGTLQINDERVARENELVTFKRGGADVKIEANNAASFVILTGEPIDEPVVGYGPFVMNSRDEIIQAIHDVQNGRFGAIEN